MEREREDDGTKIGKWVFDMYDGNRDSLMVLRRYIWLEKIIEAYYEIKLG